MDSFVLLKLYVMLQGCCKFYRASWTRLDPNGRDSASKCFYVPFLYSKHFVRLHQVHTGIFTCTWSWQ